MIFASSVVLLLAVKCAASDEEQKLRGESKLSALYTTGYIKSVSCPTASATSFSTFELGKCINSSPFPSYMSRKYISFDDATGTASYSAFTAMADCTGASVALTEDGLVCFADGDLLTYSAASSAQTVGVVQQFFSDSACSASNLLVTISITGSSACTATSNVACAATSPVGLLNNGPYWKTTCLTAPAPSSAPVTKKDDETAVCFAGSETVQTETGVLAIKDVRVGDRILAASTDLSLKYASVIAVPHAANSIATTFLSVETASSSIKLSADHLLFAGACGAAASLKVARDVNVHDCLFTSEGEQAVLSISAIRGKGVYTVVTEEEFIVVNGFVASPFALNHAAPTAFYAIQRALFAYFPTVAKSELVQKMQSFVSAMTMTLLSI